MSLCPESCLKPPLAKQSPAAFFLQIKHHQWVKELGGKVTNLPEMLGTAQDADRDWLVTPCYGPVLASLRSPRMIVDATRQASLQLSLHLSSQSGRGLRNLALQVAHAINSLAMNGHIHGDVSAHNISYQDGKATLIDLATLRPMDQVTANFIFVAVSQCVCPARPHMLCNM